MLQYNSIEGSHDVADVAKGVQYGPGIEAIYSELSDRSVIVFRKVVWALCVNLILPFWLVFYISSAYPIDGEF